MFIRASFKSIGSNVSNWALNLRGFCVNAIYSVFIKYTQQHIAIRCVFNKFPDFFVQAFRIGIDSWKFSMLLLYNLWDGWPIFMISGSNEQLQEEFEYTQLLSQLLNFKNAIWTWGHLEEWYAIKFCFKRGKNATET